MRISSPAFSAISILFIGLLLISGCKPKSEPLRVALLEWPPYELAFWARENNWFNEEQAVLLEYKTPAEVTRAFATGAVDIIAVTSDFALTLMEQHPDTRIFLVIDASNGGDTVLAREPLTKNDDFTNRRIAVESSPLGSYMLARFMDKFSIQDGVLDIQYVDIPGQVEAWNKSNVDLLITYEPIRSILKSQGAFEVFTSKDIPNEILDVFLIRESTITDQSKNLTAFIEGWFRAVSDLKEGKPEVYEFIGKRERIPSTVVSEIFEDIYVSSYIDNISLLSGKNISLLQSLNQHEKIMIDKKLMGVNVDKIKLITDQGLLLVEPN
ncbi:ABC transporter substrate-binding protein [Reinekea forsetii]|nr:ABC transporter substrate-binding protein [Reinekea forsetii]